MANVIQKTVFKKSTWKDASAGGIAGFLQSIQMLLFRSPIIASILTAIEVGAMRFNPFDDTNRTAIITNTIQDATVGILVG